MHIYMAFYRPMPTIGTQVVKNLNMANVAKLTKSQVTLMFEQRPMPVRKLTRTSGKNTSNIRPHEGTFVSNKSNSSFIAKAKLHPKLITGTTTPNSIENILMKHVEYFKYIEKKEIYIENINTLNSDMAMCQYVFTLFILFLILLNFH